MKPHIAVHDLGVDFETGKQEYITIVKLTRIVWLWGPEEYRLSDAMRTANTVKRLLHLPIVEVQ